MKTRSDPITLSSVFHQNASLSSHASEEIPSLPIFAEEMRQYMYCKRVLYWRRVAQLSGVSSKLMATGVEYHEQRNNYQYLRQGDLITHRNRYFWADDLGIGARVDLIRERPDGLYVVEFKRFYHGRVFQSHLIQAFLGGIVAETALQLPFVGVEIQYYPGKSRTEQITAEIKQQVLGSVVEARKMIFLQLLPQPTPHKSKCRVCEFQKICQVPSL